MVDFLNLRRVNEAHLAEIESAMRRVLRSGWYMLGDECAAHPIEPPSAALAALLILAMALAIAAVRTLPARPMTARSGPPNCRIQDQCMRAMAMTTVSKAALWARIKALVRCACPARGSARSCDVAPRV